MENHRGIIKSQFRFSEHLRVVRSTLSLHIMGSMIDTRGQTSVDSESIVYSLGKEQPFIQLTGMGSSVFETD